MTHISIIIYQPKLLKFEHVTRGIAGFLGEDKNLTDGGTDRLTWVGNMMDRRTQNTKHGTQNTEREMKYPSNIEDTLNSTEG